MIYAVLLITVGLAGLMKSAGYPAIAGFLLCTIAFLAGMEHAKERDRT